MAVRDDERRALEEATVTSVKRTVRWVALTAVKPTSGMRMNQRLYELLGRDMGWGRG